MQENSARRSNAQRTEETRASLVAAARAQFVKKGFTETSTPEIVKAANVTRGALYHHFKDKTDLFRTTVQAEAEAVAAEIEQHTSANMAPLEAMIEGSTAYFKALSRPGRAQLLLIDGPAVLGPAEMRQIDRMTGGEELRLGLQDLVDRGIADIPVNASADLISAMFDRAALAIAMGEPAQPYKAAMDKLIRALMV